ncbi:MAG: hypothetical protein RLZZ505_1141 [Verrucomicrobiota bacterium]|jgi:hypothetical protein
MGKAKSVRWTREELLIVLNLYHKLRYGQMDARQKVVIELSKRMGRTANAVALKLVNLASLDLALKLRGISGMPNASKLDREMWDEYHTNPAELIPTAQEKFDALFTVDESETTEVVPGKGVIRVSAPPVGETETIRPAKQRRGQAYFRDIVLNNYDNRCALTGLPVRELLVASHIMPWSGHAAERLNVRNGISLNRLHDSAFDRHLVSFDEDLRLVLSPKLKSLLPAESIAYHFESFEGKALSLPNDGILPDQSFLSIHRNQLVRN